MAIAGITDRRVLPRLGKIRGGMKKLSSNGSEYPEETPHFVLNPIEEVMDKQGNVIGTRENEHIKALIKLYGATPYELPIVFPSDELSIIADANLKWWSGDVKKQKSILMCRGNGAFAAYRGVNQMSGMDLDPDSYPEGMNRVCNLLSCPQRISKVCKPNMNLVFVIPEYSLYGVFQLDTTSSQAMSGVWSCLNHARSVLFQMDKVPSLVGVPMRLFRERKTSQYKDAKGGQGTATNYPIKIEVNKDQLRKEQAKLLLGEPTTLALGISNHVIAPIAALAEVPDYDLLPQSQHGRMQTGDIELPTETMMREEPQTEPLWQDPEIIMKFKKLSEKTGTPLTDARMEATAAKFDTKEELETYLDSKLK